MLDYPLLQKANIIIVLYTHFFSGARHTFNLHNIPKFPNCNVFTFVSTVISLRGENNLKYENLHFCREFYFQNLASFHLPLSNFLCFRHEQTILIQFLTSMKHINFDCMHLNSSYEHRVYLTVSLSSSIMPTKIKLCTETSSQTYF